MKKFTLDFIDSNLEQKYQKVQQIGYEKLFFWFSLGTILILGLTFVKEMVFEGRDLSIILIIQVIYMIIQHLIIHYFKIYVKHALFLTNLLLMITFTTNDTKETENLLFLGQNSMTVHIIILIMLDFKLSFISNIFLIIWRISLILLIFQQDLYIDLILCILTQICLILCLYYSSFMKRKLFIQTLKSQQLDVLIPQIITKPVLIFNFDKENLRFNEKIVSLKGFLNKVQNPFKYFMREAKFQGQSLETLLYKQVSTCSLYESQGSVQSIRITINHKSKPIKISNLFVDEQLFLITIEDEDYEYKMLKSEMNKKEQRWLNLSKRFFYQQIKLLKKIIQKPNSFKLAQLRGQFIQIYLLSEQLQNMESEINDLGLIVKMVLNELKNNSVVMKIEQNAQILIYCQRKLLVIYFIELIKTIIPTTSQILFQFQIVEDQIYLTIYSHLKEIKNKRILNIEKQMVMNKIHFLDSKYIIYQFKLETVIQFYKQQIIPFS